MDFAFHPKTLAQSALSWLRLLAPFLLIALCVLVAPKSWLLVFVAFGGCIAALIALPLALYEGVIVPIFRGVQCPTCRERAMVRVAAITFGYRFYECGCCGQRCKRTDYDSPWIDANGNEDCDMYKPTPFYGPARRREARINTLKTLAFTAALFTCALGGWLVGEVRGAMLVPLGFLALYRWSSVRRVTEKILVATPPVLWDREVDE